MQRRLRRLKALILCTVLGSTPNLAAICLVIVVLTHVAETSSFRDQCKILWGASSDLHFCVDKLLAQLANPNLHDIPTSLSFHIEAWIDATGTFNG
jgi:hypothetical protein